MIEILEDANFNKLRSIMGITPRFVKGHKPDKINPLTDEEWRAIRMYMIAIWEKIE